MSGTGPGQERGDLPTRILRGGTVQEVLERLQSTGMSTVSATSLTNSTLDDAVALTDAQRRSVIWEWCLHREAFRIAPRMLLISPLVLMELYCLFFWPGRWQSNQGRQFLQIVFGVASILILGGGASYAAQAVCWEVSAELRELVRLTGIGPLTLLFCKTAARWWTIACSVLLLAPLVGFAVTLGGVTNAQLAACGWGLLMLATLTAGMAAFAGISSTDSQNSSTAAATGTLVLILLYHMVFWFSAALIGLISWWVTGSWQVPSGPWRTAFDFQWQSAPIAVMMRASLSPELFSPLNPSYWIHFLTALFGFRVAAVVMVNRFNSIRSPGNAESESVNATSESTTGRPRFLIDPLLWKDAHVLSGGFPSRRRWTVVYGLLAVGVLVAGFHSLNRDLPLALGIIAECAFPVIFAVRLDALIAVEFRQQTWQGLMLLPIERRKYLTAKLRAVAWEQRAALLPVGLAVAIAVPRAPAAVLMTGVIAILFGTLLCQVSAIYYLTSRYWWTGLVQVGSVITFIFVCVLFWNHFPAWISFLMTVTLTIVMLLSVQGFLETTLRNWTEP